MKVYLALQKALYSATWGPDIINRRLFFMLSTSFHVSHSSPKQKLDVQKFLRRFCGYVQGVLGGVGEVLGDMFETCLGFLRQLWNNLI